MKRVRVTEKAVRRIIREELVREYNETQQASSQAAVAIAKGIGAYLSGGDIRNQLKNLKGEDPENVINDANKLMQTQVVRGPLNKLAHDIAGQEPQQVSGPRGKPQQAGEHPEERPTMMPPAPSGNM